MTTHVQANGGVQRGPASLRVAIFSSIGSPVFVPLIEAGIDVVGVVEWGVQPRPDSRLVRALRWIGRGGRRGQPNPSAFVRARGIPVFATNRVDDEQLRAWLTDLALDVLVVYHVPILPRDVYSIPRWAINLHPSLLPKYRGGHPLLWAVWDGEEVTGCSVHLLEDRADVGPILTQAEFPIPEGIRERDLERYAEEEVGVPLLIEAVDMLARGESSPDAQPESSPTRYAKRIPRADLYAQLPFADWPIARVWRVLRFLDLSPSALNESTGHGSFITWRVGGITRRAGAGAPGSLQWDLRGPYVSHPEGRIRLYPKLRPKAAIATLLGVGRPASP